MSNYETSRNLLELGHLDEDSPTHYLLSGDPVSYNFRDTIQERSLYSSYLEQRLPYCGVEDPVAFEVAEAADEYVPVVFYFRGIYCLGEGDDDMDSQIPVKIASVLMNVTRSLGQLSKVPVFDERNLNCVVLNRVRQEEELDVFDIMFHFPYAVEKKETIKEDLYPLACEELTKRKFEQRFNFESSLVFSYYDDPIPLYGSATIQDEVPFSYSGVVSNGADPKLLIQPIETYFPLDRSALYKRGAITQTEKNECRASPSQYPEYWIPIILSVRGHEKATSRDNKPKPEPEMKFEIEDFDEKKRAKYKSFETSDAMLKSLKAFIDCWNPWRIDEESEWSIIGEAIFNILDGAMHGPGIWRDVVDILIQKRKEKLFEFGLDENGELVNPLTDDKDSQQRILNTLYDSQEFKVPSLTNITERNREIKTKKTAVPHFVRKGGERIYRKHYFKFTPGRQTIRTIASNAREDDHTKYFTMHIEWCKQALQDSVSGLDTYIAIALYRYLWLDWMCETIRDNTYIFYYLLNNRLHVDPGQQRLKRIIVGEFCDIFKKMHGSVKKEVAASEGETKAKGENLLTKIKKVIDQLMSNGPKKRFISESSIFFNTVNASSFFDENCELTCVNTGVLVAGTKDILFRKGRLEDFITKRTAAFYLDDLRPDDDGVKMLQKWTSETFLRRTADCHWWWMLFASMLRGGNDDKIFTYIHGEKGNEGKSAWIAFFDFIFGDYSSHVDISYFTDTPKDANSATPVTSSLKGVRCTWVEEAEDKKPIQAGPLKKKTGKDKLPERGLFKDAGVMTLQTTFVGVGNDVPPISNAGLPVKERLAIFNINTQRSSDAPSDVEEQYRQKLFPRDNFFDKELEYLGAAGLWYLVQYYGMYTEKGLKPLPARMQKYTDRYWEDKDKYYRFTKDEVEVTKDSNDSLTINELYESFKDWHEKMYPKTPIPNNDELRKELRNRWGKMKSGNFIGVKLKSQGQRRNQGPVKKYTNEKPMYNEEELGVA